MPVFTGYSRRPFLSSFILKKLDCICSDVDNISMPLVNSIAGRIAERIDSSGEDTLWTYGDFGGMPETAVAAALSRLARTGKLSRIRNGVYYRPKKTRFGLTSPDASQVTAAVLNRRGISSVASGVGAYNRLGLTTQTSSTVTFDVSKNVAAVKTGVPGRVRIRCVGKLRGITPDERAAIDALRDLKWIPDSRPAESIHRLVELFRNGRLDFIRVAGAVRHEPPRVRALVGTIGTLISAEAELLNKLKASLNRTAQSQGPKLRACGKRACAVCASSLKSLDLEKC